MTRSVDVLIVGSGLVGAAYARLINESCPGASILMVELGPQLSGKPGVNIGNLSDEERARAISLSQGPAGGRSVDGDGGMPSAAMATCVGGMGVYWNCVTPRPYGSECISFIEPDDWAVAITTAERLLHTTHDLFAASRGGQAVRTVLAEVFGPLLAGRRDVGVLPVAARTLTDGRITWTGTDTLLGPLVRAPGGFGPLELRAETLCRSLIVDGDRVTGALLEHRPTGTRDLVTAQVVVVAADSLRTPQLLWASGVRPYSLGRYLNEHPMLLAAVKLGNGIPAVTADERTKPFVSLSRVPFTEPDHPFHLQIIHVAEPFMPLPASCMVDDEAGYAFLYTFARKMPRAVDRVIFSDEDVDWCGMPAIRIEYSLTEAETVELKRGLELLEMAANSLGSCLPDHAPKGLPAGSSVHYQGTVRMGERDDGTSVCNSRSRVWGLENLFVGGNGVIPTATTCNPTLTSIALAAHAVPEIAGIVQIS